MIDGNKTYITAGLAIVGAVIGLATGTVTPETAGEVIIGSLIAIFIRAGIKKAEPPKD